MWKYRILKNIIWLSLKILYMHTIYFRHIHPNPTMVHLPVPRSFLFIYSLVRWTAELILFCPYIQGDSLWHGLAYWGLGTLIPQVDVGYQQLLSNGWGHSPSPLHMTIVKLCGQPKLLRVWEHSSSFMSRGQFQSGLPWPWLLQLLSPSSVMGTKPWGGVGWCCTCPMLLSIPQTR